MDEFFWRIFLSTGSDPTGNGIREGPVPVRGRGIWHGSGPDNLLRGQRPSNKPGEWRSYNHPEAKIRSSDMRNGSNEQPTLFQPFLLVPIDRFSATSTSKATTKSLAHRPAPSLRSARCSPILQSATRATRTGPIEHPAARPIYSEPATLVFLVPRPSEDHQGDLRPGAPTATATRASAVEFEPPELARDSSTETAEGAIRAQSPASRTPPPPSPPSPSSGLSGVRKRQWERVWGQWVRNQQLRRCKQSVFVRPYQGGRD